MGGDPFLQVGEHAFWVGQSSRRVVEVVEGGGKVVFDVEALSKYGLSLSAGSPSISNGLLHSTQRSCATFQLHVSIFVTFKL